MLSSLYPWLKAFHIVSVISWMAGLLYLPRLFVNHAESAPPGSELSSVFTGMERRLLKRIMNPAMIATWGFGLALFVSAGSGAVLSVWMWAKIVMVICLTWYHVWLAQRLRDFAADRNRISGRKYRFMNEVPAVLMVIIVILVVVRPF